MTESDRSPCARLYHRAAGSGPAYWGPGDHYTFLVTGDDSDGAYFAMEALVPPGGGPPPHVHTRETETFYVLEGQIEFLLGEETIVAGKGDFVNIPIGTVHRFCNTGTETARLVLTFSPAGIERWFEQVLEPAPSDARTAPDNMDEVVARYLATASEYGILFT
jgi:quercetin dioxygenase-like cupin family protein